MDKLKKYKPINEQFTYKRFPFYWVARVSSLYTQRMEKVLKKSGITITGWRISMVLREHTSLSISELSLHCSFNPSTVTKTVYSMQKKGLLSVSQSESDNRVSKVALAPEGHDLIKQLIVDTTRIVDDSMRDLTEKEVLKITALLQKMITCLSN